MVDETSGWLRGVRPAISVQARKTEVRVLVHIAPVFGAQGEVSRDGVIGATTIQEGTLPLGVGAGNNSATAATWIKDQAAAPGEDVGADLLDGQWKVHDEIARHCMHIGLHSGFSETAKIFLRVSIKSVIAFNRKPTVDVIAVSHNQSTGFRSSSVDSVAAAVFGKEARSLHAHFTPAFLRNCSNGE